MYVGRLHQVCILMHHFCLYYLGKAIVGTARIIVRMVVRMMVVRATIVWLNIIQHTYPSVAMMMVRHGWHDHHNQADKQKKTEYVRINLHANYFSLRQRYRKIKNEELKMKKFIVFLPKTLCLSTSVFILISYFSSSRRESIFFFSKNS